LSFATISPTIIWNRNKATVLIADQEVELVQETKYPWEGRVSLKINTEESTRLNLMFRIPGWSGDEVVPSDLYTYLDKSSSDVKININGEEADFILVDGFAQIKGKWSMADEIVIEFPMDVKRIRAHENVIADEGQVAIQRGPIVYCLEWVDQEEQKALHLLLDENPVFKYSFNADLLNGVGVITTGGKSLRAKLDGKNLKKDVDLVAIPYYSWANRGKGQMTVWIPENEKFASPLPAPSIASEATLTSSPCQGSLSTIQDQLVPKKSSSKEYGCIHWWPNFGTKEWVVMTFDKPEKVQEMKIFWFDDKDLNAGCRIPKSYKVLYKSGSRWIPVKPFRAYPNARDQYNKFGIEPITTTALKLELQLEEKFSSGIQEWVIN